MEFKDRSKPKIAGSNQPQKKNSNPVPSVKQPQFLHKHIKLSRDSRIEHTLPLGNPSVNVGGSANLQAAAHQHPITLSEKKIEILDLPPVVTDYEDVMYALFGKLRNPQAVNYNLSLTHTHKTSENFRTISQTTT